MAKRFDLARPMMRRGAGFDTDQTRRQLLKERQDIPTLQLPPDNHLTLGINAVDLKHRLGDIQTDCRNHLHNCLLRIVGALAAPSSVALSCRWRSRPAHQERTSAPPYDSGRMATDMMGRPRVRGSGIPSRVGDKGLHTSTTPSFAAVAMGAGIRMFRGP